METLIASTSRSRVRRLPARGSHDRDLIHRILDEGLVAHVGFVQDGAPFVIPMGYARDGDRILLHGSAKSRLLQQLVSGAEVAVTVTLLDALVFARSAFHHSMNYRSAVILGRASPVVDEEEKRRALDVLLERLAPGRLGETRPPNPVELKATLVASVPIREATAKCRTGPPSDDDADRALSWWAGLVPVQTRFGEPESAPDLRPDIPIPVSASRYGRPKAR